VTVQSKFNEYEFLQVFGGVGNKKPSNHRIESFMIWEWLGRTWKIQFLFRRFCI